MNNEITFPAAILQPPFFDVHGDDATNYGSIGTIIGHEMTHGFDEKGRKFDKDGNLTELWSKEDEQAFNELCDKMSSLHDQITILPELKTNGKLTLGEDIADLGGLKISLQAFLEEVKDKEVENLEDLTPTQRFFIAYAVNWAGFEPEESIRRSVMNDSHSIHTIRTNMALQQLDEWYEAFDIQPEDPLYLKPQDRVSIW